MSKVVMSGMVIVISLFTGGRFDAVAIECEGKANKPITAYSKSSADVFPLLASRASIADFMIGAYCLRPASQVMLSPLLHSLLGGSLFRGIDIAWSVIIVGRSISVHSSKEVGRRSGRVNSGRFPFISSNVCVCAVQLGTEDVDFYNSAYSSVSSEVTFVAMSDLLLEIMEARLCFANATG
jgi:hypothetical protein